MAKDINIDPHSPQAREALERAQRFMAARLGGGETYAAELSGPLSVTEETVTDFAYLVHALIQIGVRLALVATQDLEEVREQFKDDPVGLLAWLEPQIEADGSQ